MTPASGCTSYKSVPIVLLALLLAVSSVVEVNVDAQDPTAAGQQAQQQPAQQQIYAQQQPQQPQAQQQYTNYYGYSGQQQRYSFYQWIVPHTGDSNGI